MKLQNMDNKGKPGLGRRQIVPIRHSADFINRPNVIRKPGFHRRSNPQRLMNAPVVVEHVVNRNRVLVVLVGTGLGLKSGSFIHAGARFVSGIVSGQGMETSFTG